MKVSSPQNMSLLIRISKLSHVDRNVKNVLTK